MSGAAICVAHLVWAPLGLAPLERFAGSYRRHPAGAEHRLRLVFNGFDDPEALRSARAAAAGLDAEETVLERPALDLDVYRGVLAAGDAGAYLFCNSYCELLADGWLGMLDEQRRAPGVGMVAASGSWESQLTPAPLPLKLLRWRRFAPFPNPHLRTNAFMLDRELARSLRWPAIRRKSDAWALEGGRASLSRQVCDRGGRLLVVGRDGRGYESDDWPASHTFRSGEQENLLIADNRTQDYAGADVATRRRLAELAWGPAGSDRDG